MIHLFINAIAASAGGGITYVRNVVPHLARRSDLQTTIVAGSCLLSELGRWNNVSSVSAEEFQRGQVRRFLCEQRLLPKLIRRCGADVLLSVGNVALFNSPVPQILLSRNALYTSRDFDHDVLSRRNYRMWLETRVKRLLAKQSILCADATVTPSEAFTREVRTWIKRRSARVTRIHHGFDRESFFSNGEPLPGEMTRQLAGARDCLRLLLVSHYNYFRNFDTLLRALPLLKQRLGVGRIKLVLTCELKPKLEWGPYDATGTARLVERLGVADDIIELGLVPYRLVHRVYKACDMYVTPSYAESFAHPLVEAMACGLPIVASGLPVHKEVCGEAALYFPPFSPQGLADRVVDIATSPELARKLSQKGLERSGDFSWQKHVSELVALAESLSRQNPPRPVTAAMGTS